MASFSREELVPGNNGCVLRATGPAKHDVRRRTPGFGPQNLFHHYLHVPARSHGGDFPSIFPSARQGGSKIRSGLTFSESRAAPAAAALVEREVGDALRQAAHDDPAFVNRKV